MLNLNIAQELFLVLFSILYGVMLQSLSGLQPFPLAKTLRGYRGYKRRDKPFETEHRGMWRRRVAWSFFLLNFFPIVYFWGILNLLTEIPISSRFQLLPDFVYIILVFLSALSVFGFYRIYHALFTWKLRSLFCDLDFEELEEDRLISFDAWAHFIWGCVYLLPPILILICLNCFM